MGFALDCSAMAEPLPLRLGLALPQNVAEALPECVATCLFDMP